jgi:hypothetical protein
MPALTNNFNVLRRFSRFNSVAADALASACLAAVPDALPEVFLSLFADFAALFLYDRVFLLTVVPAVVRW